MFLKDTHTVNTVIYKHKIRFKIVFKGFRQPQQKEVFLRDCGLNVGEVFGTTVNNNLNHLFRVDITTG